MVRCHNGYPLRSDVFFSTYLNGLVQRYPELYDQSGGDSSQYQANFGRKWKAYTSIYELADGDVEKIDRIVQQPLEKCLLFLSYRADKSLLESLVHKEAMKRVS